MTFFYSLYLIEIALRVIYNINFRNSNFLFLFINSTKIARILIAVKKNQKKVEKMTKKFGRFKKRSYICVVIRIKRVTKNPTTIFLHLIFIKKCLIKTPN
jgi:hypothetical protein